MVSIKTEPMDREPWEAGYGGQEQHCGGPASSSSKKKRAGARVSTKGIKRPGYKRRIVTPFSYVELITNAIKSSPNCMLTLREILTHLEESNECFQGSYVGWKNSVRHNLSVSHCFVKLLRHKCRPFGKDNFWALNPDHPQAAGCTEAPAELSPTSPCDVPPQTSSPLPLSVADGETARILPKIVRPAMDSGADDLSKCADDPLEEGLSRGPSSLSPRPRDSRRISTPTVPHRGNTLTSGNTLPISRFLNSPPTSRRETPKGREPIGPDSTAPTTDTSRSSVTPTALRSAVPQSTSPPSVDGNVMPREAVPHTPGEWKVLKGLYEHYWNRALQERHTFCQHLALLKDRHDNLEYQRSLSVSVCNPPAYQPGRHPPRPLFLNTYMPYGYPPKP